MNQQELEALKKAVNAALDGNWDQAHSVAQDSEQLMGQWIHAVLHKIEGDTGNSRYWYARARKSYEDYVDPIVELKAIAAALNQIGLKL